MGRFVEDPDAAAAAAAAAPDSSRGTMSIRKSNMSLLASAAAMSDLCSVRRLLSSAWIQARMVSSVINISQPLAKRMGASAEIILTSGSAFMTFLILARGS